MTVREAGEPSLGIVVASCDRYSDMWEPLFALFFRQWPDCPYPVYLVANHLKCEHPRVSTLLAGDDLDWSSTMAAAIGQIQQSHLLFWIDDAFPDKRIDSAHVAHLLAQFVQHQMRFLRLRPHPRPEQWTDSGFGVLEQSSAYRVTLFATIWDLATLRAILRPGESAWAFEMDGTERSRSLDGFYSTRADVFSYLHGVERGIWIRPTARALHRMGFQLDHVRRPVMTRRQHVAFMYRQLKAFVFHRIPAGHRMRALGWVRRLYRVLGLRKVGS
ncbi:MAG: hypothetical protein KIS62_06195 [Ramlibacter sp.]|nr:hypothetical protein [Ramlibacter sp.]